MKASLTAVKEKIRKHETLLWWVHSGWALLFGVCVMWLGAKNFNYLRIAVFHIAFIWISSLFLPMLLEKVVSDSWKNRIHLTVNYFNKNFYQQILFFILPIYWKSYTFGSKNTWFMLALASSGALASLDIVYDRHISKKWCLFSVYFTFNMFATCNVMFPILWSMSNRVAVYVSAAGALAGFSTLCCRLSGFSTRKKWLSILGAAVCLFLIAQFGKPLLPPAPLHLGRVIFAKKIEFIRVKGSKDIVDVSIQSPVSSLPVIGESARSGKFYIYALTPVKAPMGLKEKVRHSWRFNGEIVRVTKNWEIEGGRDEGYRLISSINLRKIERPSAVSVDVETENGQLIGRDELFTDD